MMDLFIYNAINHYFKVLEVTGYYKIKDVRKLLVLIFLYSLLFEDYRGKVSEKDYSIFDKALECLYGTTCLIPYTDYLKMGKLKLGEWAELISRLDNSGNCECGEKLDNIEASIDNINKKNVEQDNSIAKLQDDIKDTGKIEWVYQ